MTEATEQDRAYKLIRNDLMIGRYLPGDRLKIRDLAAGMGIGLMSVRSALQRLVAEGALSNLPNAGASVPTLTPAEFDELLEARMLVEAEAAVRGCRMATSADIARLQALCAAMSGAVSRRDRAEYLLLNDQFHVDLYNMGRSKILIQLIEALWLKAGPISNCLFAESTDVDLLNEAHESLMRALAAGDERSVRLAIERDIFAAGRMIRSQLFG